MTLEGVLQELIDRLSPGSDHTVAWEQVREWPPGTIDVFQKAGWIRLASPASIVECCGCEENCFKPVRVRAGVQGRAAQAYVDCDEPADLGRISIPLEHLQQWQITGSQVARWIADKLKLKEQAERQAAAVRISVGQLRGKKRRGSLELVTEKIPAVLRVSGHSLPLTDAVYLSGDRPEIDRVALRELVDRLPSSESSKRYRPSKIKQEARKLETKERHERWQREYRKLTRTHPGKSDSWYSHQIAKLPTAEGRSAGTIRRNLKN